MRRLALLVVVVAAVILWRVGEAHRTACINAGNVNCSVLPWSGSVPGSAGGSSGGGLTQGVGSGANYVGGSIGGSVAGSAHSVP